VEGDARITAGYLHSGIVDGKALVCIHIIRLERKDDWSFRLLRRLESWRESR
jgi:hypothetical protein